MALVSKMQEEDFETVDEEDEPQNFFITFLCLGFVKNILVTCGDDGYLFLWEEGEIKKRKAGHEDSILALDCKEDSDLFVTGSLNGTVFLWRLVTDNFKNKDQNKQSAFGLKNTYSKEIEQLAAFNVAKNIDP